MHDTKGHIWGSTLVADGKVYIGNESGVLTVPRREQGEEADRRGEDAEPDLWKPGGRQDGTLFVDTPTHLFAIGSK